MFIVIIFVFVFLFIGFLKIVLYSINNMWLLLSVGIGSKFIIFKLIFNKVVYFIKLIILDLIIELILW